MAIADFHFQWYLFKDSEHEKAAWSKKFVSKGSRFKAGFGHPLQVQTKALISSWVYPLEKAWMMSFVVSSLRWRKHLAALLTGVTTAHCSYGDWTLACRLKTPQDASTAPDAWNEQARSFWYEANATTWNLLFILYRRRVALQDGIISGSWPRWQNIFPERFPFADMSEANNRTWLKTNRHALQQSAAVLSVTKFKLTRHELRISCTPYSGIYNIDCSPHTHRYTYTYSRTRTHTHVY